jgi:hypothetical protein
MNSCSHLPDEFPRLDVCLLVSERTKKCRKNRLAHLATNGSGTELVRERLCRKKAAQLHVTVLMQLLAAMIARHTTQQGRKHS